MKKLLTLILILGLFSCSADVSVIDNEENTLPENLFVSNLVLTGEVSKMNYTRATIEEIEEAMDAFAGLFGVEEAIITEEVLLNMDPCPVFWVHIQEGDIVFLDLVVAMIDENTFRMYGFDFELLNIPPKSPEDVTYVGEAKCYYDFEVNNDIITYEAEGSALNHELVLDGDSLTIVPLD